MEPATTKKIKNLIIVDDDDLFVFLTKKAIVLSNVVETVTSFNNAVDALEFFRNNASNQDILPEIVFLDLSMPIMDGWQFLDEYAKIKMNISRKILIYIVSSSISPIDINRAKAISLVSDFLIKPVTKEELIDIVRKMEIG